MSASAAPPRWAWAGLIVAAGAAAAAALWLSEPKRGDLGPVDFTAGGPDALQFCDAAHPRFIAVTNRVSAVTLREKGEGLFFLETATGKAIGEQDLQGGRLRLFAVNEDLTRFAAGDAQVAGKGEWRWATPAGLAEVFADFTPLATGREMYASARLASGEGGVIQSPSAGRLTVKAPREAQAGQAVEVKADVPDDRETEIAAFDLGRAGPTGFVVHGPDGKSGGWTAFHLTFDDPGQYVLWCRAGAAQTRATLTVTP